MSQASETRGSDADELAFRLVVEQLLEQAHGCPIKVAGLNLERSPFATLFPAEVLSATLENGDGIRLFVKYLGSEQSDHPEKQCRDREIRIYEQLLGGSRAPSQSGGAALPVPRYYGSRWNQATARYELFLEYIDDWSLKYHDLEHWFTAVSRLACLHAYFAAQVDKLLACEFLLRFDADYFQEWANRAIVTVAGQSAKLAAGLEPVVSDYRRAAELLAGQPLTLVHNDLSPKNVIADRSSSPARIYFVDWEMAGVGCGLLDLVHLKHGLDPVNDRKVREVYCQELAARAALLPSSASELSRLFAACELHHTVYRLAFSRAWRLPARTVAQWIADAQEFHAQV